MLNKAIIVGRLGADPETKVTSSGKNVTRFNVATSETWLSKEGEKQERTEWHRVTVWGKLAETCAKYLSKGRQVTVEGRLQTRSWEDKDGNKRYTTEIVANSVIFGAGNNSEKAKDSASTEFPVQGEEDYKEESLPF